MKKLLYLILVLLLISTVCFAAFGCKAKIKSEESYRLYTYDTRLDKFVTMGASLKFGKDFSTFEYTFGEGDLTIFGKVEKTKEPDSYVISCGEEAIALVTERYRQSMVDNGASQAQLDNFDVIASTLTPRAQFFSYGGKLFKGDSVEMFRCPDKDPDAFEGLYHMDSGTDIVRLRGGFVYGEDEDGEYTVKNGRYTVSRDILTIVSLDENGKDRYQNGILMRKRYFMAKITIPTTDTLVGTSFEEQLKSSAFASAINADISEYSGKTIAVLCESFYTNNLK